MALPGNRSDLLLSKPKHCKKSISKIPPHPALSPGIGGEGKGEGEISGKRENSPEVNSCGYARKRVGNVQGLGIYVFGTKIYATRR